MPTIDYNTVRFRDAAGIRDRRIILYTGPASYPNAGLLVGDPLIPSDVSLGTIELLTSFLISSGSAVRLCYYDHTRQTLRIFVPNTGAEVAAAVDLSTFTGRFEVLGF